MSTLKEVAITFLMQCSTGKSVDAFSKYVSTGFIHHNAYFKGDRNSLMIAMEEAHLSNRNKIFEPLRSLEDGNLVAVHSRYKPDENDPGYAIIHILRFDDGKIVELWDFGQAVTEPMINENGMF